MHLLAERFVFFGSNDTGFLKEQVNTYQMAPMSLLITLIHFFSIFASMIDDIFPSPAKPEEHGQQAEEQQARVGAVGKEHGVEAELFVVDEDEEEYRRDHRADEQQQPDEEALARPDAVHFRGGRDDRGRPVREPRVVVVANVPIKGVSNDHTLA